MVQTFGDGKYIYSVDMMFAYINLNKLKVINKKIDEIIDTLNYEGWGDPEEKISYSPNDVLNDPKKYPDEYIRIKKADLDYPIILFKNNVVDGVHRLTKSYLKNKKTIKAYEFDSKLMKKFIIAKDKDWRKIDKLDTFDFIVLYIKRFY